MLKKLLKNVLCRAGIELIQVNRPSGEFGLDALTDTRRLLPDTGAPVIFDVGANRGQSVQRMLRLFPSPEIHCFEPSPTTFARLSTSYGAQPGVILNNTGLGENVGTLELSETESSELSSFLAPACDRVIGYTSVPVSTVDFYCADRGVSYINILKTDAQGYDAMVLRGADRMLSEFRIGLVVCELMFDKSYEGIPPSEKTFAFMYERGYRLFGIYDQHWRDRRLAWCDAMFVKG